MPENNFKKLKAELTPYKESFPANYLINEYNQMFDEIRFINDKTSSYIKVFLTILSSYIAYTILGLKFVLNNNPKSIAGLLYGGFGVLISILIYSLIHMAQRQYSASKKHKTRYWKSIQHIRKILCDISPEIKDYLLLPIGHKDNRNEPRPHISGGEKSIGRVWVWVNYAFFVISFFYFWIFFELSWHDMREPDKLPVLCEILEKGITPYVAPYLYGAILTSIIFVSVVSSFPLSQPERALWHYHKNLYLAGKITLADPYPTIGDDKLNVDDKGNLLCRNVYLYLFTISLLTMFAHRCLIKPPNNFFWDFWIFLFTPTQGIVYLLCIIFILSIEIFRYNHKKNVLEERFAKSQPSQLS